MTQIEHKLNDGVLKITIENSESEYGFSDMVFQFECGMTGAIFDFKIHGGELGKICPILNEPDEVFDTFNEPPTMISGRDMFTAMFTAVGRKKTYPVVIELAKRKYAPDKQDIMELRAENAVLRRKIASLEDSISILNIKQADHNIAISKIAAHLLKADGCKREFIEYTVKYPSLIHKDDIPDTMQGIPFDIMEWDNSQLYFNMIENHIKQPFIELIPNLPINVYPPLNDRKRLISRIEHLIYHIEPDKLKLKNGDKLIDRVNQRVNQTSDRNNQYHCDHNVWCGFKRAIENANEKQSAKNIAQACE